MAGENDRIYSWSAVYRNPAGPENFYSFERRNQPFINRPVDIVNRDGREAAFDHQGHIVPQNILNRILDDQMVYMAANCPDVASTVAYVTNPARPQWMRDAYDFGLTLGIEMFNFDNDNMENKFGTFFSIITWNPVNLCRAPSDDRRGGYPAEAIDEQVADYLRAHQPEQGVNANWMTALDAVIANTNDDTITDYLNACSATLNAQLVAGIGYYQFPWEYADAVDGVQLAMIQSTGVSKEVLLPFSKK